jgi:23S rRNA U2552 (ribose-2'-O)-methylase RlmE/FtsJ
MNLYSLPKNNNLIEFNPTIKKGQIKTYTTHSIMCCYDNIIEQISKINININNSQENINIFLKEFNPFEYISGTQNCVSKLKSLNCVFYDFYEISNIINCLSIFETNMNAIYIGENCEDLVYCHELLRKDMGDAVIPYKCVETTSIIKDCINNNKLDFIFYEIQDLDNTNNYTIELLKILNIVLNCQKHNGNCVIKIGNMFYKPIIDIIYIFCSLFEKVNIIKPNTSNINSFEKYLVCTKFISNTIMYDQLDMFLSEFISISNSNSNSNIFSIIKQETPVYFLNKIDDINIILGQQQLESIDQIINIFKNKNKDEKIELLKKVNIQKCISWCEKYKIPHNKFIDKQNIFLPLKKYNDIYFEEENENNIENFEEENEIIIDNV